MPAGDEAARSGWRWLDGTPFDADTYRGLPPSPHLLAIAKDCGSRYCMVRHTNYTLRRANGTAAYAYLSESGFSAARHYSRRRWICSRPLFPPPPPNPPTYAVAPQEPPEDGEE
uniref:Protein a1 n=1 Tax=Mastomys natalensis cytomegalovirus 2 TaxID=2973540 RepID=A0A9Y1N679_9BETA|nr:protein a1 [Mastomys natalensis cytomegalovirus 2]WEG69296.1 protein a1 [Mastomys natalensis cytomegalovirus 2]WEG69435.1 protein a1 [Mastomys natalensis cytomegalovirus 2]WEG69573.1 protein a1 [Mastomys natalensis cytomegalovirus 2]WEG71247.1 protein a1 [Mastomys natalensis cytomegalovirus 2]